MENGFKKVSLSISLLYQAKAANRNRICHFNKSFFPFKFIFQITNEKAIESRGSLAKKEVVITKTLKQQNNNDDDDDDNNNNNNNNDNNDNNINNNDNNNNKKQKTEQKMVQFRSVLKL